MNLDDARDSGDDDQRTPKTEAVDGDDQMGAGRYPSRLRQDPKKAQIFQPDTTPARMTRNATNTHSPQASPAPGQGMGAMADHRAPIPSVTNYVPQQPMPLTLRQVVTPGNNPELFRQRMALAKMQKMSKNQIQPQQLLRGTLPPSQLTGPNIYIRCLYGLRSGIQEQQDFALHHLVKVSYERADKFKFEGFPMLAETLIAKALEITELLYDTKWDLSYAEQSTHLNVLNGSFGTPNLLERIENLKAQGRPQGVESAEFQHKLSKVTEAIVVLRNMCWLDDNASFVSHFPYFREFLVVALNLPKIADISEYEHCALKISEDVTPFLTMTIHDPLLHSLLKYVESEDRGAVLSALKAIDYISGELPHAHKLTGLSPALVERICYFTTLLDEELQLRALKILYQYTSHPENLREIFSTSTLLLEQCVPRMVDNLMYDARIVEARQLKKAPIIAPPNTVIPTIPPELLVQLIQIPESDRSKYWLRSCFEEDQDSDITQIAIWQAYQAQFSQHSPLAASEFIKNVSSTFSTAQAQVINGPQPRFIIKGIRPRRIPIDLSGNKLQKCLWEIPSIDPTQPERRPCGTYHLNRQGMWTHILHSHLHFQRDENHKFLFAQAPPEGYKCCWPGCHRTSFSNTRDIGTHISIHLPDDASLKSSPSSVASIRKSALGTPDSKSAKPEDVIQEAEYSTTMFFDAPTDERGHVYGIPAVSMRILHNLARNINKLAVQEKAAASVPGGGLSKGEKSFVGMVERIFPNSIKAQLAHVFAHNRTLGPGVMQLMAMIEKGESSYRALREKGAHREEDRMIF